MQTSIEQAKKMSGPFIGSTVRLKNEFTLPKKIDMDTNGWRAPEYDLFDIDQEIAQQFAVLEGGAIEQHAFYFDINAAAAWYNLCRQAQYLSNYHPPADWPDKIAGTILHHLKKSQFDKNRIDVIGLGVGDGEKETSLCGALLRGRAFDRLRCFLLDISTPLAMKAHKHFVQTLGRKPTVQSNWLVGSIYNLPRYTSLFHEPEDKNIMRVGTLFSVLDNVRHERDFIEKSLRPFKSGDVLIVDPTLCFAPADDLERVRKEDPTFETSVAGLEWLENVIRRYRPQTQEIRFDFEAKTGASTFPKAYTVEIKATLDNQATFSIFQKHRYEADDFIQTWNELGWKPLDGILWGPKEREMIYVFTKK